MTYILKVPLNSNQRNTVPPLMQQVKQLISHVRTLKKNSNNKTFLSAQLLSEITFISVKFHLNCNKLI